MESPAGWKVELQDSPARGVRKRNEIRIHPRLHCVRFAMKIIWAGSGPRHVQASDARTAMVNPSRDARQSVYQKRIARPTESSGDGTGQA